MVRFGGIERAEHALYPQIWDATPVIPIEPKTLASSQYCFEVEQH